MFVQICMAVLEFVEEAESGALQAKVESFVERYGATIRAFFNVGGV